MRLYHELHSACIDQNDEGDTLHLTRLHDVLVDVPIFEDCRAGLGPFVFRTTAIVFDWADGGDAHSLAHACGGIAPAEGATIFRQVLRGLRALHRRGIAHRDIKVYSSETRFRGNCKAHQMTERENYCPAPSLFDNVPPLAYYVLRQKPYGIMNILI